METNRSGQINRRRARLFLLALAAAAAGCAHGRAAATAPAALLPPPVREPGPAYRIQLGDELDVKFLYQPDMNEHVPVRPDGRISLPAAGEIAVVGMTPSDLERLVVERTSAHLRDPEVSVIVTKLGEQRVYIGGEVARPGYVALAADMTPLQAVLQCGGFKKSAKLESVLLLTPGTDGAFSAPALAARSFFYSVFKHRRLVIGVFLLVFVASATMALLRPRTWRATTKVLVKVGEAVQLAPAEAPSRSINVPLNPDVIAGEAEIVKSRQVLEEAVARVGIKPESGTSLGEMISKMQMALTVAPAPGSNVLQISYLGRHPDRAARLVNTLTDVYVDHHNRAYANEGIHSFYADQLRILEAEMKVAQHRLRAYLRRTKVVDADQEIHILNQDLQDAEKSLRGHRQKIRGGQRKLV